MKKKTKVFSLFMICLLLVMMDVPVQAKKTKNYWPKQPDKITAGAAILMDIDTGTILYKKNINKKYYPASITKILSVLVAVENSRMDEVVTFSHDSVFKTEGSGIWRDVGEKMTMEQCLYAVMLESANECAYAVAEHISGTMEKFVKLMNEKAKKLGCKSSNFTNPHGLPDENHYVTAKDMAIISRAAYENETFRLLCGTKRYVILPTNKHKEPTYLTNHHKMLYPKDTAAYLYDYCTGGKTGYTIAAGNTLVTYAQKDGMTLVSVILNGTSPQYWNETRSLLEFGFENFNLCNVAEYFGADENNEEEKLDTLNANDPFAQIDPQAKVILPKSVNFNKTEMTINYENLPENSLAQLIYTYGNRKIGTADIIRTNTFIDNHVDAITESTESDSLDENIEPAENQTAVSDEPQQESDEADRQAEDKQQEKTESGKKDLNLIDSLKEKIQNMEITEHIQNFDIHKLIDSVKGFFQNKKLDFSGNAWIVLGGIFAGIVLILIFKILFNRSYVIRQKLANYRNRKIERKKYVVIRDYRKGRKRKNR